MKKSIGIYVNKGLLQLAIVSNVIGKFKLITADSIKIPLRAIANAASMSGGAKANPGQKDISRRDSSDQQRSFDVESLSFYEEDVTNLFKKYRVRKGEIVTIAMPPELVAIRYFQMLRLSLREAKSAVPFEARKYLPYKLEDISYAYAFSYESVPANKMMVTFVAAEKSWVNNYIKFFTNITLKPGYMEAVPYSLMRFFYYISKESDATQTIALIHINKDSASINLIKNKVLYLTRNVSFTAKMTQAAQIEEHDADVKDSQGAVEKVKFDVLFSEIKISFYYFHRQFPEEKIENMVIWSDGDNIKEWAKNAGKELNVSASAYNPFDFVEGGNGCSVDYAVVYGLALRNLYEPNKDINLNPSFKNYETLEIEQLIKTAAIEIGIVLVILVSLYFYSTKRIDTFENELDNVMKQRPQIQSAPANYSVESVEIIEKQTQEKFISLRELTKDKLFITPKLNKIGELIPDGMWIDSIDYRRPKDRNKQVFILSGCAHNIKGEGQISMINMFLDKLKKDNDFSQGFKTIKLDYVSTKKNEDSIVTSFQISCSLE